MKIRLYKKNDEKGLLKLDSLLETHPWNRRDKKNWHWKYKGSNPFGKSIIVVAEDKKKIIATFSIIPIEYRLNKKLIKGSHSIAMLVHPDWQKKGVIKLVVDKAISVAKKNKIKFIYGYPNDNAYEIHKLIFDYKDISNQYFFHHNLKLKTNQNKNENIKEIRKFTKIHKAFLTDTKKYFKIILDRNAKFLNWRYISRPDNKYYVFGYYKEKKFYGYCVLKLYRENKILRGHIIDIITNPKEKKIFSELIKFALGFFKKHNCNESNLWLQGSINFQKILLDNKFKLNKSRKFICKFNDDKLKSKFKKNDWYFTMGDTLEIY
jgi:GNAT superfamily N-acetyltransferase